MVAKLASNNMIYFSSYYSNVFVLSIEAEGEGYRQ